jgi:hypothetical protein
LSRSCRLLLDVVVEWSEQRGNEMMNPAIVQAEVSDRQQRLHAEAVARRRVRVSRASARGSRLRPRLGWLLPGRVGRAEVGGCVHC